MKRSFDDTEKCIKPCYLAIAPMVDQSELAFRMFVRDSIEQCPAVERWRGSPCPGHPHRPPHLSFAPSCGTVLSYSPMIEADRFITDDGYAEQMLGGRSSAAAAMTDQPLIAQFAAHDPKVLKRASYRAFRQFGVAATDLNLGCPQPVAKRGLFGAHLAVHRDEETVLGGLAADCVRSMSEAGPVSVKTRIISGDAVLSERFARLMVDRGGACLLAVHGRTLEQNRRGAANWSVVRRVVDAVGSEIPVLSNGSVSTEDQLEAALSETKAAGIMSAQPLLVDPFLFRRWMETRYGGDDKSAKRSRAGDAAPDSADGDQASQFQMAHRYLTQYAVPYRADFKQAREHTLSMLGLRRSSYQSFFHLGKLDQFFAITKHNKNWRAQVLQSTSVDEIINLIEQRLEI